MYTKVARIACPLLILTCCLSSGCISETSTVDPPTPIRDNKGLPQQVLAVPQELQDICGQLLRHHAKYQSLPDSIGDLQEQLTCGTGQTSALGDYAYHPKGLGLLRDGRVVLLADSTIRIEGHLWCIVRDPNDSPRSMQLNVTPIAITELEAAAKRAP